VRPTFNDSPEFARLVRGETDVDLVRIALEIARDAYPSLDLERPLARIETLAERVKDRCASTEKLKSVLGQVNWVLFVEEGFQGNDSDYYDPRNSYLNEVLDRKTGIPLTLSLLYWRLAERMGLEVSGLNLPAHFMLKVASGTSSAIVDPFHSGIVLDRDACRAQIARLAGTNVVLNDAHFAPCPLSAIVSRMLANLRAIYLQKHEYAALVPILNRLAMLSPSDADVRRELGLIYLKLDRLTESVAALQEHLDCQRDAPDNEEIRLLVKSLRREIAARN
jgi:regulator of sirC expression with transglutaminase-like and TPR domain